MISRAHHSRGDRRGRFGAGRGGRGAASSAARLPVRAARQLPAGNQPGGFRRDALAELLRPSSTLVVEDDGEGVLGDKPLMSIGEVIPERTVLIRSYSKSHGPDLPTCGPRSSVAAPDAIERAGG